MKYAIWTTSSPIQNELHDLALATARSIIENGYELSCVFFWGAGTQAANSLLSYPRDETNYRQAWQELALNHGVSLKVCISSAARYGVFNETEAKRHSHPMATIADYFEIDGLGSLVELEHTNDRVLRF